MTEERLLLSTTSTIQFLLPFDRNLTNEHMICLNSGREILCKAINYCHHLLFTTVYGKFEQFGCDQPDNEQAAALAYIPPPNDNYQQICILSGLFLVKRMSTALGFCNFFQAIRSTKLCYCSVSRCNEQWIVDTMQREFSSGHILYLLIGLAFIIVLWNVLLCYINRRCMKITRSNFSLLLPIGILSGTQKSSLFLITFNIVISACLLVSSWIPAIVTCESRSVGRHIAEVIFLPQIFRNISPLSLIFISFGFLPLLHIPTLAFCMVVTINEELSRMHAIKIFMICYGIALAIIYYLAAYLIGRAINSFEESFHLECTFKTKHWMVAVISAYLIGTLCMITAFLLITIRSTKIKSQKKDDPLVNDELAKNTKLLQQESNVSTSTAHSASLHLNHNTIELSPEPFVVNTSSNGILNLRNTYCNDWVALRILTNNSELNIHPTKFLLPPGRTSAAEVAMTNNLTNGKLSSRLLIQWYMLGAYCPARNVDTLWTRPYYVPRDQWHYKIIRIYFDFG